jgi:hypothetical protein
MVNNFLETGSGLAKAPKSSSFPAEQVFPTSNTRIRPSAYRFTPFPRVVKSACGFWTTGTSASRAAAQAGLF